MWAEITYRFHWLCTQLSTHGVAAFCSCFPSAIMLHTTSNIDNEMGILLAMYILLGAAIVVGEGQPRENYCDLTR